MFVFPEQNVIKGEILRMAWNHGRHLSQVVSDSKYEQSRSNLASSVASFVAAFDSS